jgi:hypothetical protein
MSELDLPEFRAVAEIAIASGSTYVLVNPEHVVAMADRIRTLEAELAEVRSFLRRTAGGGSIVSTGTLSEAQIAYAHACRRIHVDGDGLGFVYVPAEEERMKARIAELETQLESDRADYDEARKLLYRQAVEADERARVAEAKLAEREGKA